MRKICIVTYKLHAIDGLITCMKMNKEYKITSIVLASKRSDTIDEYLYLNVYHIKELEKCILEADEVLISNDIKNSQIDILAKAMKYIHKYSKHLCNDTFRAKERERFSGTIKNEYTYTPINIPIFIITTMSSHIGAQGLFLNLIEYIQTLGEKVVGITNDDSMLLFQNIFYYPNYHLQKIESGGRKILLLNSYIQNVLYENCGSILIVFIKDDFCNPYLPNELQAIYDINLIECACTIDFHINVIPLNFLTKYAIENNNKRISQTIRTSVDINVISNVLLDVPNQETFTSSEEIPRVIISPAKANNQLASFSSSQKAVIESLVNQKVAENISAHIINKLRKKDKSYSVL